MTSMTSARIITSRSLPETHLNVSETHRNFNDEETPSERLFSIDAQEVAGSVGNARLFGLDPVRGKW